MHFIGIDIGTSSICGVIYNFSDKNIKSITRNNHTYVQSPNEWEKIQDATKIIEIATEIILELSALHVDIKGIGVTGQMHGMLYVNNEGNAVSPLYTWQDGRANLLYKDNQTYAEYLSQQTGYPLATGFGLVTHFYNKENRLVPEGATRLCTIMDYLVMKLSGRKTPLIDYSNGASLGFFNKEHLNFDLQSLEKVGIDVSVLPELSHSAALAGYYNGNIPVYTAIGDNQASFLGSVRDINKSIHVTVGTSSQISVYSEKYTEVDSVDTRPFPGGGYILVGAALCGGKSVDILKTFFENTLRFLIGDSMDNTAIYDKITSIAYREDSSQLPVVETLFDGTRFAPSKKGSISNISISNLTPENLIIGFLKGICRELYDFYDLIPQAVKSDKTVLVGSGNGIKMNPLLCRAFEEQFGCRLLVSQHQEEAAFGACICAIVGGKYREGFHELA